MFWQMFFSFHLCSWAQEEELYTSKWNLLFWGTSIVSFFWEQWANQIGTPFGYTLTHSSVVSLFSPSRVVGDGESTWTLIHPFTRGEFILTRLTHSRIHVVLYMSGQLPLIGCLVVNTKWVGPWTSFWHETFPILSINGLTLLLVTKLTFPLALARGSQGTWGGSS